MNHRIIQRFSILTKVSNVNTNKVIKMDYLEICIYEGIINGSF